MSNQPSDSPSHNYRPRSPDLSGFVAPPPPRLNRLPSVPYHTSPDSGFPPGYSFSPRGSYDASPYFSPQATQPLSYFGSQSQPQSQSQSQSQNLPSQSSSQPYFSQPQPFSQSDNDDMARLRARNQRVNYNDDSHQIDEFDQTVTPVSQQSFSQFPPQPQSLSSAPQLMQQQQPIQPPFQQFQQSQQPFQVQSQPPPFQAQPFPQQFQHQQQAVPPQPSSTLPQIDIRTKFPVARIKRIMQADEDIGKVAQATPTAVAKALELFMIALVSKGSLNAKEQQSKRVTATHLKNALLSDSQFDFLTEICENVPDEGSGGGKRKKGGDGAGGTKSEESDADEEIVGAGQQKKKGRVRKKKGQSGDESD